MPDIEKTTDIAALTVQLLSAYLANNTVASEDLSGLIRSTKAALTDEAVAEPVVEEAATYTPAVSVRKSQASSEHLLSLIDGKPYKTLKRHLASHGLTPEAYRERYNLPSSYPMVAPDFAAKRRAIAEKIGLGSRRQAVAEVGAPVLEGPEVSSRVAEVAAPVAVSDAAKGRGARKSSPKAATPARSRGKGHAAVTAPAEAVVTADKAEAPKARRGRGKPAATPAAAGKPQTGKPQRRSAGSLTAAPAAVEPAPAVTEDVSAKPAPKRRGKLGLFGKGGDSNKGAASDAASTDGAMDSKGDAPVAGKPRGAGKSKRMARTPKDTPSDAV